MADKNGFTLTRAELTLALTALNAFERSVERSKTKEAKDEDMTRIYDKRLRDLDDLRRKLTNLNLEV